MSTNEQRWAEIEVLASGDDAQEAVGALLTEVAGCQGYASTQTTVTGYLPVDERIEGSLLALRAALAGLRSLGIKGAGREITVRFVAEADWANAWKQYFKPQRIGERIVIKPTWEEFAPKVGDVVVEIDPGMAFGTGLHATTRLCLRALETMVEAGDVVADVGTGSGILAVAAVRLGAARAVATDVDPLAVRIARENIAVNGVDAQIEAHEAALPPPGAFDIVVANILADVILGMASELYAAVKPGGVLIASGIISHRAEDVRRGLAAAGFAAPIETATESEWAALIAQRL